MQALSFRQLERELAAVGAAPSVIARITEELKDHCADTEAAARDQGAGVSEARRRARESLGSSRSIVAAVAAQPDLLNWRYRWPQSARCLDSLAFYVALPAAPFVYCALHPAPIVRWSLSSSLAACVTATILFALQWLIT